MGKYLYEHKKIKRLRYISQTQMERVPDQRGQLSIWCDHHLLQVLHFIFMDCTRFTSSCCEVLLHSFTKALAISRTCLRGHDGYMWVGTAMMIDCPSCLSVEMLRRLTLRTLQFISLDTSAVLRPPCSRSMACSHLYVPWVSFSWYFSESVQ